MAKKENAHRVAKRIHSLLLMKFTSRTTQDAYANHDDRIPNEEDGEGVEDSGTNSTDDEEISDDEDGSSTTSQSVLTQTTSINSDLCNSADQAAHPRQECPSQPALGQQMIDQPTRSPSFAAAFPDEPPNGMSSYPAEPVY